MQSVRTLGVRRRGDSCSHASAISIRSVSVGSGRHAVFPKKFVAALTLGRGIRYSIVAALGFRYGNHILRFFSRYYKPAVAILIALAVIGAVLSVVQYLRYRKK